MHLFTALDLLLTAATLWHARPAHAQGGSTKNVLLISGMTAGAGTSADTTGQQEELRRMRPEAGFVRSTTDSPRNTPLSTIPTEEVRSSGNHGEYTTSPPSDPASRSQSPPLSPGRKGGFVTLAHISSHNERPSEGDPAPRSEGEAGRRLETAAGRKKGLAALFARRRGTPVASPERTSPAPRTGDEAHPQGYALRMLRARRAAAARRRRIALTWLRTAFARRPPPADAPPAVFLTSASRADAAARASLEGSVHSRTSHHSAFWDAARGGGSSGAGRAPLAPPPPEALLPLRGGRPATPVLSDAAARVRFDPDVARAAARMREQVREQGRERRLGGTAGAGMRRSRTAAVLRADEGLAPSRSAPVEGVEVDGSGGRRREEGER